jgi:hypothetical protein
MKVEGKRFSTGPGLSHKAFLRLASSLEYVLWEEEADKACVQQPLLDQRRRREEGPYSWVGSKVKNLSGATFLLSRAYLFLFGKYMLMSNQL